MQAAEEARRDLLIAPATFGTGAQAVRLRGAQTVAMPTHPAFVNRRHPQHQRIVGDLAAHHSTRPKDTLTRSRERVKRRYDVHRAMAGAWTPGPRFISLTGS